MKEEPKTGLPAPKEAEIKLPDEKAKEAQLQEAPPEAAPAEAAPTENPEEFDAKTEIDSLKDSMTQLAEQVSMLKEAWDKLAEEENPEQAGPPEGTEPPEAPGQAAVAVAEPEEAKHSKALSAMQATMDAQAKKIGEMEAQLAKFSNQGIRRTVQSTAPKMSAEDAEYDAYLSKRFKI